jgi:glutamate/aspartate transport system permease protein
MLNYTFDWNVLWQHPYGGWMLEGILTTICLSLLAWGIALPLGITLGTLRTFPQRWVRAIIAGYVEVFRNVPLLLQLFFWYFAGPELLPYSAKLWLYNNVEPTSLSFYIAAICLALFTASRIAEHTRSGLSSIPKGQYLSAFSSGLSTLQVYRCVIVPYAVRIFIPPLTTEFVTIFKNSALAMTIGVIETTYITQRIDSYTFHGLEATTGAIAVYLCINLSVAAVMGFLERYIAIPGLVRKT